MRTLPCYQPSSTWSINSQISMYLPWICFKTWSLLTIPAPLTQYVPQNSFLWLLGTTVIFLTSWLKAEFKTVSSGPVRIPPDSLSHFPLGPPQASFTKQPEPTFKTETESRHSSPFNNATDFRCTSHRSTPCEKVESPQLYAHISRLQVASIALAAWARGTKSQAFTSSPDTVVCTCKPSVEGGTEIG